MNLRNAFRIGKPVDTGGNRPAIIDTSRPGNESDNLDNAMPDWPRRGGSKTDEGAGIPTSELGYDKIK